MKTLERGIKTLSICLLLIILSGTGYAAPYKPTVISDVTMVESSKGMLNVGDRTVEYSVSYQSAEGKPYPYLYNSQTPAELKALMIDSWSVLKYFLNAHNISVNDCRSNYNINIFVIKPELFLDRERFKEFWIRFPNRSGEIYGYYDPTLEIPRESAILVSKFGYHDEDIIFVHEMAHYWWNRLCVSSSWSGSSEDFAMDFQRYYERVR